MKFAVFILLALIVLAPLTLQVQAQTQSPDTVIIEVGGSAWNKTTLKTLIVTAENQSWWSTGLVNSTLRAIDDWNKAITFFSSNYSGYAYFSAVNLAPEVSNQSELDFDVYINFSESVAISSQDAIGLTTTLPYSNGTVQRCEVTLAATSQFVSLTEKDIQSVATHELGHVLGIGHSNSSSDLMYPLFDVYSAKTSISTLDLYGVAESFRWIANPEQPVPFTVQQELTLPPNIDYAYAPETDLPPETLSDNPIVRFLELTVGILGNPFILSIIIVGIVLGVTIELYFRRRWRKNKSRERLSESEKRKR